MGPKTKNLNRIVATPPARAPVTLRDVHDRETDPRRRTALRQLEAVLDVPLENMPAKIGWIDALAGPADELPDGPRQAGAAGR